MKGIGEWVGDDHAFGAVEIEVVRYTGRLKACVGSLVVLGTEKAEMFAEQLAAERCCEAAGRPGLTVHVGLKGSEVFNDDGNFGIVVAKLGAVVEIGRAADDYAVVGNHYLLLVRGRSFEIYLR